MLLNESVCECKGDVGLVLHYTAARWDTLSDNQMNTEKCSFLESNMNILKSIRFLAIFLREMIIQHAVNFRRICVVSEI